MNIIIKVHYVVLFLPPLRGCGEPFAAIYTHEVGAKTPFETPFYDNFRCKDRVFLENKQAFLHFFFFFLKKN